MKTEEEIRQIVERIKKNRIGCSGCMSRYFVIDFLKYHNPASREALVELSQYKESAFVQQMAIESLELCDQAED